MPEQEPKRLIVVTDVKDGVVSKAEITLPAGTEVRVIKPRPGVRFHDPKKPFSTRKNS